ncbi:hypothetical protein [Virgibacillus sp.]|uniref:hypothetical protein n=1 Tax=Virgibacillus sp. TaxID=1872700 RepID=UPI0017CE0769|nr:hypothetical protein [Virgibacillus sp.]NWO12701.1 hypothetical protein [Virgibacillus sp.]
MKLKEMVKKFVECRSDLVFCDKTKDIVSKNNDLFFLVKKTSDTSFEYQVVSIEGRSMQYYAEVHFTDDSIIEIDGDLQKSLTPVEGKTGLTKEQFEAREFYVKENIGLDDELDKALFSRSATLFHLSDIEISDDFWF